MVWIKFREHSEIPKRWYFGWIGHAYFSNFISNRLWNLGLLQKKKVEFPFVTQWIMIQTNQADVYVAFSADGQQGSGVTNGANNFFTVQTLTNESPGSMPLLRLKCKEIFLKDPAGGSTVTIIAGLTNVPSADFPDISKIVGVGRDATVTTL